MPANDRVMCVKLGIMIGETVVNVTRAYTFSCCYADRMTDRCAAGTRLSTAPDIVPSTGPERFVNHSLYQQFSGAGGSRGPIYRTYIVACSLSPVSLSLSSFLAKEYNKHSGKRGTTRLYSNAGPGVRSGNPHSLHRDS